MCRLFFAICLIISGCVVTVKRQPGDIVLAYPFANDSFLVRINNLATAARPGDTIHLVYYGDESLKSGQQMEGLIKKYEGELRKRNYVFVGMAHFGQYRVKRRRDFIAPSVKTANGYEGVSSTYGQADSFYFFLRRTIMPLAEKQFEGHVVHRSFVGHSLGGLFATYLFANGDSLLTDLYALSPALWIDDYHILNYESSRQQEISGQQKNIWVSCGSRETFNRIKAGVTRIGDTLSKRAYPAIRYRVKVYEGKTHNSSVAPTLEEIIQAFSQGKELF